MAASQSARGNFDSYCKKYIGISVKRLFHICILNTLLYFPCSLGTPLHILPSSHFSNLRIDVVASKGDLVVSYEGKTLIVWDMKAGAQKATFTADKVSALLKHRRALRDVALSCPLAELKTLGVG